MTVYGIRVFDGFLLVCDVQNLALFLGETPYASAFPIFGDLLDFVAAFLRHLFWRYFYIKCHHQQKKWHLIR